MRPHPPLATVSAVDLQRYLGSWYEIERLPARQEPEAATDVSAHYSLNPDGSVRVHNRCLQQGTLYEWVGQATPIDASNSKLQVTFTANALRWVPFTRGDYWVMQLDAGYTTTLVGSPDRRHLWLLARLPQMDATTRRHYIAYARQQGFDVDQLIHTPHTGHPTAG
ncbi:lipocalin family protein [Stenotrophomonas sp.]|uniref:lipocalin family protein n=1 Tax=Stenotrophomonas sp. TaxID=69392 RepID=UPI0028ADEE69|nr:lipocalin family protein [Stenotrophomonas sp.]